MDKKTDSERSEQCVNTPQKLVLEFIVTAFQETPRSVATYK